VIGVASLSAVLVLLVGAVFFYAYYRFHQLKRSHVAHLVAQAPGKPFDLLLVGSDSRAFVDSTQQAAAFGSKASQTGQRSDVIIIARIVPATRQVKLLSIPRDTYVNIPGHVPNVSGPNRINVAYDSGPSLLVQTIAQTFHIPVTYYAEVNFPGFAGMVDALGGVYLDFRYPVRDAYSGLDITHVGCQLVAGAQALGLVRSRHLYYFHNGAWQEDYGSDWSRIQRQDAFFRAVVSRMKTAITNPFRLNSFLGAATKNVQIDQSLSEGEIISLARIFRSFSSSELQTETLPTIPFTTNGQDVLLPAQRPDEQMISQFLAFGTTSPTQTVDTTAPTTATKTAATLAPGGMVEALLTSALSGGSAGSSVAPVTTVPAGASANQNDVVYNTQPEPWNPTTCSP